jgi:hypothetical protein
VNTFRFVNELEMAERHVAEGQARIARQWQLIDEFARRRSDFMAHLAIDVLATMERAQQIAIAHLQEARARALQQGGAPGRPADGVLPNEH